MSCGLVGSFSSARNLNGTPFLSCGLIITIRFLRTHLYSFVCFPIVFLTPVIHGFYSFSDDVRSSLSQFHFIFIIRHGSHFGEFRVAFTIHLRIFSLYTCESVPAANHCWNFHHCWFLSKNSQTMVRENHTVTRKIKRICIFIY